MSPWSKPMLPWEQQNTGSQTSANQNHSSPNLSWMMFFCKCLPTLKKKHQTHKFTSTFRSFGHEHIISFSLKPRASIRWTKIRFSLFVRPSNLDLWYLEPLPELDWRDHLRYYLKQGPLNPTDHNTNVGGWTNPFEKYWSKWKSSPNRGEDIKKFETTTPNMFCQSISKGWLKSTSIACTICTSKRCWANRHRTTLLLLLHTPSFQRLFL